jgi:hypothetical protein
MAALFKKKTDKKAEGLPPAAGDIAIRAYRKNTKDGRKKKERTAFEEKLKAMAAGYKSKKV